MPPPRLSTYGVTQALKKLGSDIREARLRRSLPLSVVAARAFTSRPTLRRVEAGDPKVSMAIYAGTLQALGLLDNLADVAAFHRDSVAILLTPEPQTPREEPDD